jgi:hypothetical protein
VKKLGMPKGTKLTDNPKNTQIKLKADKKTVDDLDFCCKQLNLTKSDVLRLGIEKVKQSILEKK